MDFEFYLEKIGLSQQEAKVYLSALKLGVAKASDIAQKANIKREASYYVLKSLEEKGLVSEVIRSGVKYYNAIQPKRILEILEEEKQQKTDIIKEIIPELEKLQKIAITRPKVEFYEGVEGFKTVLSILLQKRGQVIYCYVSENIVNFLPTFSLQFRRRRRENNISLKVITHRTKTTEHLRKMDKEELRKTRFNDAIMRNSDSAFYILSDAILILKANEKEQLGIYIKEKGVAKLQKDIFERVWKESKD
ncbi:MAG TPA: helix-turn-helix domain-containing protein [Candidatus Nanoarchaeia archaeon]|nr:helix-turn-helix domain-containing protein [Candidatus Nanoarchaeia archaeon]